MKTSSAKAKGRSLQNTIREQLKLNFPELEEDDIKCQIMGCSGVDILLSPAAKKLIPYSIECKNQEKLNIWESLKQCEKNSNGLTPVLFFKRNRTDVYAVIKMEKFMDFISPNYTNYKSYL